MEYVLLFQLNETAPVPPEYVKSIAPVASPLHTTSVCTPERTNASGSVITKLSVAVQLLASVATTS